MVRSLLLSKIMSSDCAPPSPTPTHFGLSSLLMGQACSRRPRIQLSRTLSADSLFKCCIFKFASSTILFLVFPCAFQNVVFIFSSEHKFWLQETRGVQTPYFISEFERKSLRDQKSLNDVPRKIMLVSKQETLGKVQVEAVLPVSCVTFCLRKERPWKALVTKKRNDERHWDILCSF